MAFQTEFFTPLRLPAEPSRQRPSPSQNYRHCFWQDRARISHAHRTAHEIALRN